MTPQRIQRSRARGWRKPAGAVVVSRPSKWGNPYVVHEHTARCGPELLRCPLYVAHDREDAVRKYWHLLLYPVIGQPEVPTPEEIRAELAGKDLVCWCPLEDARGNRVPCHADVLLAVASGEAP